MDVIFDIDGTLMNIEHRRHFVSQDRPDWVSFKNATHLDTPNDDIVDLCLLYQTAGARILICTGRNESQREITEMQLKACGIEYSAMEMRWENNYEPDHLMKQDMLKQLREQGYNPTVVFDDRDSVVQMWREAGLTCCQVARGDF